MTVFACGEEKSPSTLLSYADVISERRNSESSGMDRNIAARPRRDLRRSALTSRFEQEIENEIDANRGAKIEFRRCLHKAALRKNEREISEENARYPLSGQAISFWETHSDRRRRFGLTFEFTKPDRAYFGDSPYR